MEFLSVLTLNFHSGPEKLKKALKFDRR